MPDVFTEDDYNDRTILSGIIPVYQRSQTQYGDGFQQETINPKGPDVPYITLSKNATDSPTGSELQV